MSKASKNTRLRIVNSAWKLFYEQGYENTTIDDIIESAHISKGSFYHYFESKDALIGGISYMLDELYEEIIGTIDPNLNPIDKLVYLTTEIFFRMENTVPVRLLSKIMASQLSPNGDRHMLDPDRNYFRVVRSIIIEGKEQHLFSDTYSTNEIGIAYALFERGLMYDWCVSNGNYPFSQYSGKVMRVFLTGYTIEPEV